MKRGNPPVDRGLEWAARWRAERGGVTVAIVGLGQIGGSIGMALLKRRMARQVIGIDPDPKTRRRAVARGACHKTGPLASIRDADLVILAAPAREIVRMAPSVIALAKPGSLITDVGSTKREIQAAYRRAPRFVAGHPMCGTEHGGIDAADPELFLGTKWVLSLVDPENRDATMVAFVLALGARPFILDSKLHDRCVALTSHLPYVLALLLSRQSTRGPDLGILAAGSFRSATRVAAQPPDMGLDILLTNRFNIAREADTMARHLSKVAAQLRSGKAAALRRLIEEGRP